MTIDQDFETLEELVDWMRDAGANAALARIREAYEVQFLHRADWKAKYQALRAESQENYDLYKKEQARANALDSENERLRVGYIGEVSGARLYTDQPDMVKILTDVLRKGLDIPEPTTGRYDGYSEENDGTSSGE